MKTMKDASKIPPQSIDAEKALLGAILLRPEVMHDVVDVVTQDAFYVTKHRLIFKGMLELFAKNDPIDLLSLTERLRETDALERAGGASYLAELLAAVPSSANAKHYADVVQRKHLLRLLIETSHYIQELGYSESDEVSELLDLAEKRIFDITATPGSQKFRGLSEMLGEAWDRLERLSQAKDALRGVPTGFPEFDSRLAGFQPSDLIILAARPSMGKTALALDIARRSATMHKTSVGIFSLEMSQHQIVDRMLAADSQVDAWRLRTGKLRTDEEFSQIRESLDRLEHAPIYIDDRPGNHILNMRSIARRLKREKGLDLIIVDYLQLMLLPSGRTMDSMVQQVTEISRSLKQLARELDVPVIALSQLSRAVEQRGGRPRLSDLRDSGSIEQDADVVMFIHREDKQKEHSDRPNIAEILIEKHRNGPTGKVELYFNAEKATFLSLDKNLAESFGAYGGEPADADDSAF